MRAAAALLGAAYLVLSAAAPAAGIGAHLQYVSCWSPGIEAVCASMHVPEDHARPEGRLIEFPVVILTNDLEAEEEAPIFVLGGGGPGNSVGMDAAGVAYHRALFEELFVSEGRDVVVMEQRGVGRAEPSTHCFEVVQNNVESYREALTEEEAWSRHEAALVACRRRLLAGGIDIAHYDTVQSAGDVEALRAALGYEQIVLYGASYAAHIAFEVMRRFPQRVAAVILDSPSTPDFEYYPHHGELIDEAIDEFIARCERGELCRERYPRLRSELAEVLERLDETPRPVVLSRPGTDAAYEFLLDRPRFVDVLFDALYDPESRRALPAAIRDAHQGSYVLLTPHVSTFLAYQLDEAYGDGLALAVSCREELAHTDPASVRPYRERYSGREVAETYRRSAALCERLALGAADRRVRELVSSDIPTLVLAGAADPITPLRLARDGSRHLSRRTLVSFSDEAHYLFYNECARRLAKIWLDGAAAPGLDPCFEEGSAVTIEGHSAR